MLNKLEIPNNKEREDKKNTMIGCCTMIVILIAIIAIVYVVHKHIVNVNQQKATVAQEQQEKAEKEEKETQEQAQEETKKIEENKDQVNNEDNNQETESTQKVLEKLFKLSNIKDKSNEEVNNILGQPSGTRKQTFNYSDTHEQANDCFVNVYDKEQVRVEVTFIDGKAGSITVMPKQDIPSSRIQDVLDMFSLDFINPTFSNQFVMRWEKQFGVYEFSLNISNEKISDIIIKLDEKYKY